MLKYVILWQILVDNVGGYNLSKKKVKILIIFWVTIVETNFFYFSAFSNRIVVLSNGGNRKTQHRLNHSTSPRR